MDKVHKHFEEEATEFDDVIEKYIPRYRDMIRALVETIPQPRDEFIRVFDIGSGTGNVMLEVKRVFPYAHVTGLDFSETMLKQAKEKLEDYTQVDFLLGDLKHTGFPQCCDVVVSSLALHHLVTDKEKLKNYQDIYHCLNRGGYFFNADVVIGPNEGLDARYQQEWRDHLRKSFTDDQIDNEVLVNYHNEDYPVTIGRHIELLEEAGFVDIDVIWKNNQFAVYGGRKPPRK